MSTYYTIFSSKYKQIKKELFIVDENDKEIHRGEIFKATDNAKEAFECVDLVFIVVTAMLIKNIAKK